MIFCYDTLIQFLAAIYVTLSFDNVLFRSLWSMSYVSLVEDRLYKAFKEDGISTYKEIEEHIKENSLAIERCSRRRGLFMLFFSIVVMWYSAKERIFIQTDDADVNIAHLQFSIILLCAIVIMVTCRFWHKKKSYSFCVCLLFVIVVFVVVLFVPFCNCTFLLSLDTVKWYISHVDMFCLSLLVLPLFYQLVVNWLYSDNYAYLLCDCIMEEEKKYNKALKAKCDMEVPDEYKKATSQSYFDKKNGVKQDTRISNIKKIFINRIVEDIDGSSTWRLLKNAIKYIFKDGSVTLSQFQSIDLNGDEIPQSTGD